MKKYPTMPEHLVKERNYNNLAVRWRRTIQPVMTKFISCYKRIKNVEKSGWNEDDYMSAAIKDYEKNISPSLNCQDVSQYC